MQSYILRRLLLAIPTLILVTIIVFGLVRLIPTNIIDIMVSEMGEGGGGELNRAAIEHALGMDVPAHVQYLRWIGNILHGDFGNSLWRNIPVSEEIINRLPITLELGLLGICIALIIALPIGIYSAIRQDTVGDYLARSFAIFCIAIPSFWLGSMVMIFPSIWWGWSPPMKYIPFLQNPIGNLQMFIIPAFILGMAMSGITMRMTRTMMLEVLRQDYVRTAWSKGLIERTVVFRHALKNALVPVITLVGLQLPVIVGGTVILEQIFNLPGIGRLLVGALINRDYVIISGVNVFLAVFVLLINLLVDLTYGLVDPRVRYQ